MTKAELKKYTQMNAERIRLEQKMAELRAKIEKPRTAALMDGVFMPKGGWHKDWTDELDALIDLQEAYSIWAKSLAQEQLRIETAISKLDEPIERVILEYRYIDGYMWEEIADKLHYCREHLWRIHSRALQNLMKIQ